MIILNWRRHPAANGDIPAPSSISRGQMAIECSSCPNRFKFRVNMEHKLRYLAPIRTFRVCIKQPQISNDVLLVVHHQRGVGRRRIVDIWIKRWFPHDVRSFLRSNGGA
jgi:hypothetical protein